MERRILEILADMQSKIDTEKFICEVHKQEIEKLKKEKADLERELEELRKLILDEGLKAANELANENE